jgi:hypothetical protein
MNEKDLIAKLNNAKNLSPDKEWLTSNRALFLTQIANSGADKLSVWQVFYINFKSFAKASSQPVFASFVFLLVLVASSIFGHKLFSEAKPNDTLYVARVISEKAKLNTVLDANARDKMAVKFATRHAEDISELLANPEFNTEENKDRIEKLNEDFNKEIETVKSRIAKLEINQETATEVRVENENKNNEEENSQDNGSEVDLDASEEISVSIASDDDLKAENGIELSIKEESNNNEDEGIVTLEGDVALETTSTNEVVEDSRDNISQGSSTEEIAGALLEEVKNDKKIDAKLIEEVKILFEAKKYSEAIEKLNQLNNLIQ